MDMGVDATVSRPLYSRRTLYRRHRSASDQQENGHGTRRRNRLSLNNGAGGMKMSKSRKYSRGGAYPALGGREESRHLLEQYCFERYVSKVCTTTLERGGTTS